jgi:hypothetical protein
MPYAFILVFYRCFLQRKYKTKMTNIIKTQENNSEEIKHINKFYVVVYQLFK